jgi:fibronectin type 3 domain-containing protein
MSYACISEGRVFPMMIPQITVVNAHVGVQLSWNPSTDPDISHYEVHMGESAGTGYALIGTTSTNYYVAGPFAGGRVYYFLIYAVDFGGNRSLASDEIVIQIP